jgi:nitrogen fixation/metabolism regulation signal transduction histidine kinase
LLLYFTAISILPIFAMGLFTYLFMNRALDRWFTQIPETVAREARDIRRLELMPSARSVRRRCENARPPASAGTRGRRWSVKHGWRTMDRMRLLRSDPQGQVQRAAISNDRNIDNETIAAAIRPSEDENSEYTVVSAQLDDGRKLVLGQDKNESVGQMIENSLQEYSDLKQQQNAIRQIGLLTLGVLTFLLIFASSWMAFYVSRGLTTPILALAKGADRVAKGELGYQVDTIAEDELETLVGAFNQMSATLKENADELSERRRYIETVVNTLPTGVVSLDANGKVSTINPAAVEMLRLGRGHFVGVEMSMLVSGEDKETIDRIISRSNAYRARLRTMQTSYRWRWGFRGGP